MRERRIRSDEVELAVREWGEPDHPTVLLVHGYPDTSAVWTDVADRLAGRFHVVAYDIRGAGGSTAPADSGGYRMTSLLADLATVIEAVGYHRPVHLVGHDWGALQGWAAVSDPRTSGRIASFTSTGGVSIDHLAACLTSMRERGPRGTLAVAGQLVSSAYIGFFQTPVLPEAVLHAVGRRGWERVLRRQGVRPREWHPAPTMESDARTGLNLYRANMLNRREERGGEPPQVTTPVQIIVSAGDRYLSPELAKAHAEWVERAWVRRAPTGHWIQLTHPDLLSRWITEFIDAVDGAVKEAQPLQPYEGGAFDGQLVVVTGAGSGIGRATAYGFAANGARVIVADIDEGAAKRTMDGIVERGGRAHFYGVDVADADAMAQFAEWVRDVHGVPDVVVNNAAISIAGSLLDTGEEDWTRIRSINFDGVYRGCRLFGRQMVERGQGGHLVNLASMAAYAPAVSLPAYAAIKAGVLQLSECLRLDLADHGIGVSAICPGIINTPITSHSQFVGMDHEDAERLRERSKAAFARRGYPAEKVALAIMRAVLHNRPVVPVAPEARVGWLLSRFSPSANRALARLTNRAALRTNTRRSRGMIGE